MLIIKNSQKKYNEHISSGNFGIELILDIHDCDKSKFNEKSLRKFLKEILKISEMKGIGEPHFWEEETGGLNIAGTSVFQFISTSNIVIHTMTETGLVCCNIFTCKDFDADKVAEYTKEFFGGKKMTKHIIERGVV